MGKALVQDDAMDKEGFVDELKPGTKLMHGQYTIESFLNAGGFGITYLAKDSLDRKIVIKECFPGAFCRRSRYVVQARSRAHQNELKSIVRLFVQEARSLAKLDHPNIVGVHQVFEDNDTAYMALDFVEGRDLLDTIEDPNHGLTPVQIKSILKEVLGAVGFIHDQGMLHRDISPDNILINQDYHPVLIDFGAAREEATKQSRVLSALRVVKDGYSPQEFYIAGSAQNPSSDLYALAASFYHLINKDVPPNSQARLAAIASGDPDPYEKLLGRNNDYDENFLGAVDKALAVLPKDRIQSANDWLALMEGNLTNVTPLKVATGAVPTGADSPIPPIPPSPLDGGKGKSKLPLLLGSAAVLLAGVGAFAYININQDSATSGVIAAGAPQVTANAGAVIEAPQAVATSQTTDTPEAVEAPQDVVVTAPAPATPEIAAPETLVEPEIALDTPVESGSDSATPDETNVVGRVVEDAPTPEVRPEVRPDNAEIASLPAIEAPVPQSIATPRPVATEPDADVELPNVTAARPAVDTLQGDVVLPATPESIDVAGIGHDLNIPAVTPGNEIIAPDVDTSWNVQLPFSAATPQSNVIGDIATVSPLWVQQGLEITSVNRIPVSSIAEIPVVLQNTVDPADTAQLEVTFGTLNPVSGEQVEHEWVMPVIQQTALLNGAVFESAYSNGSWQTTVTEMPAGTSDLRVGDVLRRLMFNTQGQPQEINERESIANIIKTELNAGSELLMFAVEREGTGWVVSLPYNGDE